MNPQVSYERVREQMEKLKLDTALAHLDSVLEQGSKEEKLPIELLDTLFEQEINARFERRIKTNYRLAGLPVIKSLDEFDYEAQPMVPKQQIKELTTLRFLHNGENIIFVGPCGVGKTHLSIGLGLKVLEAGYRIAFKTLHELIIKARLAREKNKLQMLITTIQKVDVFILDELGFLPLEAEDANFLFEVVNARYQAKKPLILTSNKPFSQWEEIFPDRALAVAVLDRLLHHAHTIHIRGESYRLRHRQQSGLMSGKEKVKSSKD